MIKCEKLENDKYKTDFRGKLGNLVDEFIVLTEKFAEEVLNIGTIERWSRCGKHGKMQI